MAYTNPGPPQTPPPGNYTIKTFTTQDLREDLRKAQADLKANPSDAGAHYELASALSILGRNEEAEPEFREALRLNPNHADAHLGLGMLLDDWGDTKAAAREYAAAVRLNPDLDDAHLYFGNALSQLGQLAEARREWTEVVEINKKRFSNRSMAEVSQFMNVREALERLGNP